MNTDSDKSEIGSGISSQLIESKANLVPAGVSVLKSKWEALERWAENTEGFVEAYVCVPHPLSKQFIHLEFERNGKYWYINGKVCESGSRVGAGSLNQVVMLPAKHMADCSYALHELLTLVHTKLSQKAQAVHDAISTFDNTLAGLGLDLDKYMVTKEGS